MFYYPHKFGLGQIRSENYTILKTIRKEGEVGFPDLL